MNEYEGEVATLKSQLDHRKCAEVEQERRIMSTQSDLTIANRERKLLE